MAGTNKRITYSCLAIAYCKQRPIDGVKSVGLSFSRSISNIYQRGSSSPIATYGQLPDIELTYSSHATEFLGFDQEPGLTNFASFDVMIGDETSELLSSPIQSIRLSQMVLSSVSYKLTSDGLFSIDRTFKGWNKSSCGGALGHNTETDEANILSRPSFDQASSTLPSIFKTSPIQSINVSMSINRSFVNEFATRKPYATYINFPIETTCEISTIISNSLDQYSFDAMDTACKNGPTFKENIALAICGGSSINIKDAYLTSFNYSGADAQSQGSNLQLTATYTGYQPPQNIKPVIYLKDITDPCECP